MASTPEKLLVVESDEALKQSIVGPLRNAGYEVSTDYGSGMKSVLAFSPDGVILGADPQQLDCCGLLSEIKGSERTQNIRVIMLSQGGAGERARAMDLGADDVLSLPFEPQELLSRVRWQMRNKKTVDEFEKHAHSAEENREIAHQVVAAVNEERRTLRTGGLVALAIVAVAGLVFLVFYRRTQQQNTRVYAAITRLQGGMVTQQSLVDRSHKALQEAQHDPLLARDSQKLQLQKQSEDLRSKIASGQGENVSSLQNQLSAVEGRLQRLEAEGTVAQNVIQSYEPSVCLIHVVVGFRDHATGLMLHYVGVKDNGEPFTDDQNNPLLGVTGSGPEVHVDVFGTGFMVSGKGEILTNHHVAEPWWENDDLQQMIQQGVDPAIVEMTAYFPGVDRGIAITTEKISSAADVALLKETAAQSGIKQIAFADGPRSAVSGSAVVLLGYPTGLDAILARTGEETLKSIASASKGDPRQVMEELARRHLIRPTVTQGHIGDVLPDKIIYDARRPLAAPAGLFSTAKAG